MNENKPYEFRLVLLGDTLVGKTSIMNQFLNDIFYSPFTSYDHFYLKEFHINNNKVEFHVWN